MNFYYNYFSFIGGESKVFVICHLSSFVMCLFLKKVDFPDGIC